MIHPRLSNNSWTEYTCLFCIIGKRNLGHPPYRKARSHICICFLWPYNNNDAFISPIAKFQSISFDIQISTPLIWKKAIVIRSLLWASCIRYRFQFTLMRSARFYSKKLQTFQTTFHINLEYLWSQRTRWVRSLFSIVTKRNLQMVERILISFTSSSNEVFILLPITGT